LHSGGVMMLLAYVRCVTYKSVLYICVMWCWTLKMLPMELWAMNYNAYQNENW